MTQFKKKIYTLIIIILISIVVVLLYPTGIKLLTLIRNHDQSIKHGQEIIYSYIDEGDIKIADQILENKYTISRFKPVTITNPTWTENSYDDIYWRFNYYNLEPVRNLLYAWEKTNNPVYKNKLIELTESFIDKGLSSPYSWDYHGVSFRTMTLIDVQAKLKAKKQLPTELDQKITETLRIHGQFLADPNHFEQDYNHGLDQAAALYLLATNYPTIPEANTWQELSANRISAMFSSIIDTDGLLVENSPYYHLYVLEKLVEINKYLKVNHLIINGFSNDKISQMISYVTYMLQPDLTVPTIGASLKRQINLDGPYAEMADDHPDLLYVLSKGTKGKKPTNLNMQYKDSGQTIMRSGWGKGDDFSKQTQLIFDVGNYRTNHSDLDALSFNLFGQGIALMPDAGLYTYEAGPYRTYFHGTKSHNTVVVDGQDQAEGLDTKKVSAGTFEQGPGYVYQSGEHSLYDGVIHQRSIVMIENSTILIIDHLKSDSIHTYEQMFHLFPGAKISSNGLTLKVTGDKPEQSMTVKQYVTDGLGLKTSIGQTNPLNGLCSNEYKIAIPCYAISYIQKGQNVSYVTAISLNQNQDQLNFDQLNQSLNIQTKKNTYKININESIRVERNIEADKKFDTNLIYSTAKLASDLNNFNLWQKLDGTFISNQAISIPSSGNWVYDPTTGISNFVPNKNGWTYSSVEEKKLIFKTDIKSNTEKAGASATINNTDSSLQITTPNDGSYYSLEKKTQLDLSKQNIYFKIKIDKTNDLSGVDFYLSNNNWQTEARFNVSEVIHYQKDNRDNEWDQFGVGKGELRKPKLGNWYIDNKNFDWSKIDSIKLTVQAKNGHNVNINIKDFSLVPDDKGAQAIIVFDDGWDSVLTAADIMNKYGVKGNVAVISGSVGKRRYLTLDNLRTLQNDYGWNIASHSSLHKNAVETYVNNNNLTGLETDISDALQYLIKNNLNSAPNWYIYPDGSTDGTVKQIVSKYYKFARATFDAPQIFPYAEKLEVGTFPVYSDRATPIDVHNAVSDAIKYNQTLFLMFHKISQGTPTLYTEFSANDFETIIKDIKNQGLKVVTLSELDDINNIPKTEFTVNEAIPEQLKLDITVKHMPSFTQNVIMNLWRHLKNFCQENLSRLNLF